MRVSLTPEQRAAITGLDAKVVVIQDEVIVDVRPSTSGGAGVMFGLVGALITSSIDSSVTNSRVKAAQDLMGPFYLAIEDLDFRQEFNDAVQPALANYPIKVTSVATTPVLPTEPQIQRWRAALRPGQSLMLVVPHYRLSADMRTFYTETFVTIWGKGGDDRTPLNKGVLHFQSAPMGPGDKDSLLAWSANNAAAFRASIKEALAETMVLMRTELDLTPKTDKAEKLREFPMYKQGAQTSVSGSIISESDKRVALMGSDGKLYSLPKLAATAPKN
jgi:hypothetical protein